MTDPTRRVVGAALDPDWLYVLDAVAVAPVPDSVPIGTADGVRPLAMFLIGRPIKQLDAEQTQSQQLLSKTMAVGLIGEMIAAAGRAGWTDFVALVDQEVCAARDFAKQNGDYVS